MGSMGLTAPTAKLRWGVLVAALLGLLGAALAAQQLLAAVYLLQVQYYLQPPPRLPQAQFNLQQADVWALHPTEIQVTKARLAQMEAATRDGLAVWQLRRQAVRALEAALQSRPGWGQGWAHLAGLRLATQEASAARPAWRLGVQLAPHEGLALPMLCRVAAQLPEATHGHALTCR